jgi:hypothetical protein
MLKTINLDTGLQCGIPLYHGISQKNVWQSSTTLLDFIICGSQNEWEMATSLAMNGTFYT